MRQRMQWVASIAQLLLVLDVSVVNVALPSIQTDLDLTDLAVSWLALVYTLGFAGVLLVGARLGDVLGPVRALRWGITGFTLASLAAGLASDPLLLITARAAQGVTAAIASPATFALLTLTFPEGRTRVRAIAWWTAASLAGGGIGNVLSGVMTQWLTWRAVFLIAVPIGALVLLGTSRLRLPESGGRTRIDVIGALLVTAAFTLATYVLSTIDSPSRSWWVVLLVTAGVISTAIIHQVHATEPLIPRTLWRNPTIVIGNAATFIAGMTFQVAIWYFLTFLLQHRLGLTPAVTGLAFVPLTMTMLIVNTWITPRLITRHTLPSIAVAGALIASTGLIFQAVIPIDQPYLVVLAPALVIGLGAGLFNTPLATLVTSGIGPAEAGAASGMMNTAKQFGGAIGLAIIATSVPTPTNRAAFAIMAALTLATAILITTVPSQQRKYEQT